MCYVTLHDYSSLVEGESHGMLLLKIPLCRAHYFVIIINFILETYRKHYYFRVYNDFVIVITQLLLSNFIYLFCE